MNRRTFLGLGASILAFGPSLLYGQEQNKVDYYFVGEHHLFTKIHNVLRVHPKGVSVGLEGMVQGLYTQESLNKLAQDQDAIRNGTVDFLRTEFDTLGKSRKLREILRTLQKNRVSPRTLRELNSKYNELIDCIGSFKTLKEGGYLQNSPGFRYAPHFIQKGVKVYGMETPEHIQKVYGEFGSTLMSQQFNVTHDYQRILLGLLDNRLKTDEGHKAINEYMILLKDIESFALEQDIILGRIHKPHTRKELEDYMTQLGNSVDEKTVKLIDEERTQAWMDYLKDKTPVMMIFGDAHTSYAKKVAKKQNKSYRKLL